ncbi:hypothetical protein AB0E88_22165 [Streptomyces sp. NPDC028635]|uniref:hypothetical protein n=1 Tax=Streptomyces sp. NPDC028635 TaxID=3154800 RepID=UPI0033EE4E5B
MDAASRLTWRGVPPTDWSHMRARNGLAVTLIASAMTLTGACGGPTSPQRAAPEPEHGAERRHTSATSTPTWDGKEEQEDAMRRATQALNAAEPEGVRRIDEGMESLAQGLNKSLTAKGRPHTLDVACQAPGPRTVTLTLTRGAARSEWDVTCGDREADRFNIPADSTFTARVTPLGHDIDGLVSWRFNAVDAEDVDGCEDEVKGCEDGAVSFGSGDE